MAVSLIATGTAFADGAEAELDPNAAAYLREGSYAKEALDQALKKNKLEIEPNPDGKVLRKIWIENLDVFAPNDGGFLRWFNIFHMTTRAHVTEREVLLRPGQKWSPARVAETERRLRNPLFTILALVAPIKAPNPGQVDLIVVTRDVWSLRLNSNFEIQDNKLTTLSFALTESNFLGRRMQLGWLFDMDQGKYRTGPLFLNPNIAGSRLTVDATVTALFSRDGSQFEGTQSNTTFAYPLWSLATRWGAGIQETHFDGTTRVFQGTGLLTYDNPDTTAVEEIPWKYRNRQLEVETWGVHSRGSSLLKRFTVGHELKFVRPKVTDDFAGDAQTQAAFERDVLPRSERTSVLWLRTSLFSPKFVKMHDWRTYDLSEDLQLGPSLSAEIGTGLKLIGSENNFVRWGLSGVWTLPWTTDGFVRFRGSLSGRLLGGELIDNSYASSVRFVSPRRWGLFRVVLRGATAGIVNDTGNRFLRLGGDNGLRGHVISQFIGTRRINGNLELRSMPLAWWFLRFGMVAFYDFGHVADRYSELDIHHGFGIGLRFLAPQGGPPPYRLDWSFASKGPTAGFPGRFTFGVFQAF